MAPLLERVKPSLYGIGKITRRHSVEIGGIITRNFAEHRNVPCQDGKLPLRGFNQR